MLNVDQIKADFPIFKKAPDLVFLDNASTSQKPETVLAAMDNYYRNSNANIHRGVYLLAEKSDLAYEEGRRVVADFIGARPEQIIFTKNSTEAANLLAFGIGEVLLEPGSNIVVSELEHHANFLPWQEVARRKEAEFRVWPLNEFLAAHISPNTLDEKTKVVALTMMSNVLGVKPDLKKIIEAAQKVGSKVILDASQSAAHVKIDVAKLGADAVFFTGHKVFGPMGVGVLWLSEELAQRIPPMITGGGMVKELPDIWLDAPAKFEAGTPNVAGVVGLSEAIKFIQTIGLDKISEHESELLEKCKTDLASIPRVNILGAASSIIAFEIEGVHPHDIASILAEDNVCIRAGHHCAKPLMRALNVQAVARASFSIYNSLNDVEKLVLGVKKALNTFK